MIGERVYIQEVGKQSVTLDKLENLPNGVYVLEVQTNDGVKIVEFLKGY